MIQDIRHLIYYAPIFKCYVIDDKCDNDLLNLPVWPCIAIGSKSLIRRQRIDGYTFKRSFYFKFEHLLIVSLIKLLFFGSNTSDSLCEHQGRHLEGGEGSGLFGSFAFLGSFLAVTFKILNIFLETSQSTMRLARNTRSQD